MIVSISEAEQFLGVASGTDTTLITSYIEYSQALVENYTGNKFEEESIEGEVLKFGISRFDLAQQEIIDTAGYDLIAFTRYTPISDVTVYNGDETLIVNTDYKLDTDIGKVEFYTAISDYADNITIDYTAGYATVPGDVKFAVLEMVSNLYAGYGTTKGEGDVESKKLGEFSVKYASKKVDVTNYSIVLDKYKIINV